MTQIQYLSSRVLGTATVLESMKCNMPPEIENFVKWAILSSSVLDRVVDPWVAERYTYKRSWWGSKRWLLPFLQDCMGYVREHLHYHPRNILRFRTPAPYHQRACFPEGIENRRVIILTIQITAVVADHCKSLQLGDTVGDWMIELVLWRSKSQNACNHTGKPKPDQARVANDSSVQAKNSF